MEDRDNTGKRIYPANWHDLGQTKEQRHRNISYPWVIVEGTGCDDEQIASEHHSFSDAYKKLHRSYDKDEIEGMPVDIMRRKEDGTLTTEF